MSVDKVVTGLELEIWPERDVINKDGQGFAFTSRALTAAIITQLFSYMIGKGIQYGYVCTGEVFVFLHISDDPSAVYSSICIPKREEGTKSTSKLGLSKQITLAPPRL